MRRSILVLLVLLGLIVLLLPLTAATAGPEDLRPRSRAEVEALIEKEGRSAPPWWSQTQLRYPRTLDLAYSEPPRGQWNPNRYVGQYIWSVINENPSRWHEGVRFLHHLLTVNRSRPESLKRVMNALGNAYHSLLRDWARAAFWWRMAGQTNHVLLADCYWQLGCKQMAVEVLQRIGADCTRNGTVVKLWSDMGELDRALNLAAARGGTVGYLAAGDACRLHGRFQEAVQYYDRVLAVRSIATKVDQHNQIRARASREAVLIFDALDLSCVRPGKYVAQSMGFKAPVRVEVVVQGGRIQSVVVTNHQEKQFYASLTETPQRIIEKQGVRGVDATSGATITSEAIINATAKALAQGLRRR